MDIKSLLNRFLIKRGYQIIKLNRLRDPAIHRAQLLGSANIDLVIDVGASKGQFGEELRKYGYEGRIVSFEPLGAAYEKLSRKCSSDPNWTALHMALGNQSGEALINISENSFSSSMLDILPSSVAAIPKTKSIGQENIRISSLDTIFEDIAHDAKSIYLKMDVQGYEENVLSGATASLERIDLVQLEISLAPMYRDEPCFPEMHALMEKIGYRLISLEPTLIHPHTGEMLQIDGIYRRAGGKPSQLLASPSGAH